jgi:hypothetical protein
MTPENPPSDEELARELAQVRAAQPEAAAAAPAPSVGQLLKKRLRGTLILWTILVIAFIAIYFVLNPGR